MRWQSAILGLAAGAMAASATLAADPSWTVHDLDTVADDATAVAAETQDKDRRVLMRYLFSDRFIACALGTTTGRWRGARSWRETVAAGEQSPVLGRRDGLRAWCISCASYGVPPP
jgi:hypothetical protein